MCGRVLVAVAERERVVVVKQVSVAHHPIALAPGVSGHYYTLLTTRYSLLATHYPVLITHYSLPTTHYPLLPTVTAPAHPPMVGPVALPRPEAPPRRTAARPAVGGVGR